MQNTKQVNNNMEYFKHLVIKIVSFFYSPYIFSRAQHLRNQAKWYGFISKIHSVGRNSSVGERFKIHGGQYIDIGDNFHAGNDLIIEAWSVFNGDRYSPCIKIGNNVTFTDYDHISCINRVYIGDGTLLGRNVLITDNSHGTTSKEDLELAPMKRKLVSKGDVVIGRNVWIGRCVTIMSGVTIGDGAVIGANAVVTRNVAPYSVVAGVPAKIVSS